MAQFKEQIKINYDPAYVDERELKDVMERLKQYLANEGAVVEITATEIGDNGGWNFSYYGELSFLSLRADNKPVRGQHIIQIKADYSTDDTRGRVAMYGLLDERKLQLAHAVAEMLDCFDRDLQQMDGENIPAQHLIDTIKHVRAALPRPVKP